MPGDITTGRHKATRWRLLPHIPRRTVSTVAAVAVVSVLGVTAVALDRQEQPQTRSHSIAPAPTSSMPGRAGDGPPSPRVVDGRGHNVSRFGTRTAVPQAPRPQPGAVATVIGDTKVPRSRIVDRLYMSADLNVWSGPGEQHTLLETLPTGTRVAVTGEVADGRWAEISHEGLSRWVNAAYLTEDDPTAVVEEPADAGTDPEGDSETDTDSDTDSGLSARGSGLSAEPCAAGSEVESGLTPDAIAVHRAVCALFPEVTAYGGLRADSGEHGEGRALDIMITGPVGDEIAEFVRANSGALGVSEVLWEQQIWTVERSSEGWRTLEDRGSVTANHYDHVHVTVYGG